MKLNGKIVLALTANPYYTLGGVRQGVRLATAARRLALGKRLHWGSNDWYVIAGKTSNGVLKVRHGIIWEVGIANKQLTNNRAAQLRLLRNFYPNRHRSWFRPPTRAVETNIRPHARPCHSAPTRASIRP